MQVGRAQRRQLTTAGAGVGREPEQQPDLLGLVSPPADALASLYVLVGRGEQLTHDLERHVPARCGLAGAAKAGQRLAGQQAFAERPAQGGAQRPHVQAERRCRDATIGPCASPRAAPAG